jgi:hypothetical protein
MEEDIMHPSMEKADQQLLIDFAGYVNYKI